jgi:hypothetical protein
MASVMRRTAAFGLAAAISGVLGAQTPQATVQEKLLLAAADSALAMYSRGDVKALGDMMTAEARTMSIRAGDTTRYSVRTREQFLTPSQRKITERGFEGTAHVSGPLGMVWLPYDLYIDGTWSHCGVDLFTFISIEGKWRLASLAWTVEQPPACRKHPAGPPQGG